VPPVSYVISSATAVDIDMDRALELLREYGYLVVFFGTVIDQSGIPVFIVSGGILIAAGILKPVPVILLSILSLLSTDILFILVGNYFRNAVSGNYSSSKSVSWLKRFLVLGTGLFLSSPRLFYLFSKVIPLIGKYVPVFAGFSDSPKATAISLFAVGDLICTILFLAGGFFLGDLFISYSRSIAVLTGLAFLIIFLVISRAMKREVKKKI